MFFILYYLHLLKFCLKIRDNAENKKGSCSWVRPVSRHCSSLLWVCIIHSRKARICSAPAGCFIGPYANLCNIFIREQRRQSKKPWWRKNWKSVQWHPAWSNSLFHEFQYRLKSFAISYLWCVNATDLILQRKWLKFSIRVIL